MPFKEDFPKQEEHDNNLDDLENDLGFFKIKTILKDTKPIYTETKKIKGLPQKKEHFLDANGNILIITTKLLPDNSKEILFEVRDKDGQLILWENGTRNLNKISGYINPQEQETDINSDYTDSLFYEILEKLESRVANRATSKIIKNERVSEFFFELSDGLIILKSEPDSIAITIKNEDQNIIFFERRDL